MINRRNLLKLSLGSLSIPLFAHASLKSARDKSVFKMPDESHIHKRTWMAFVANNNIWPSKNIPQLKKDLALLAITIAKYEPVSILVASKDKAEAKALITANPTNYPIELIELTTDDFWLRDTGPVFVSDATNNLHAIDLNFNGWGNKQTFSKDKLVASFIAKQAQAKQINTHLVLEGGCFEVDGQGTAIMTKSCIINENRNPGLSLFEIETELKNLLGLRKIIWLEGIKGKDITDAHTDYYAKFSRPGEVLVHRDNSPDFYDYELTRQNIDILSSSTDADGNPLKLTIMDAPEIFNEQFGIDEFAPGYIGYYLCNGAVIAQKFGDEKADKKAKKQLQAAFPDRIVEQITTDAIASGGGTIHCAVQQEPSMKMG